MAWALSSERERRTTSWPVVAATSAIPEPMMPEPTMPMRAIAMMELPEGRRPLWGGHEGARLPLGRFAGHRIARLVRGRAGAAWLACCEHRAVRPVPVAGPSVTDSPEEHP